MSLIELLWVSFPLFLSFLIWKYFFQHLGWWGAVPSLVLGCGLFALLNVVLIRIFPGRERREAGAKKATASVAPKDKV